ncbi:MAG: 30S ribosomal protein S20 [Magnetococcales bacterium]|nr:30S ribosomal protein S20 [Magnetococcales bacterium]MBF0156770.1 30S ribosomal protein S20 [Magnetococcales bacterium]
MANIKSALKRVRQTVKRTARNKDAKSRMRTFSKKVLQAVESGDINAAQAALREAVSVVAVSARKGVIHSNQAARRMRRLNARVKQLATASAPS